MLAKNTHEKYRKNLKNNKCNKILVLEKGETKKDPEMSANNAKIANITRIFLLAKNSHGKYRKNRKNNKFNKILVLEKEETKKGPEMSAIIAKIANIKHR